MSLAIEYIWAQKADMPTARFLHSASVVDGKIYVIGGTAKDMTEAIFPVEVYDPVMDEWTTEANIPAPRAAHSASVVDGKIYVIGGAESPTVLHSTVLEYDPVENTWTTKSDMPTARWFFSTSVVNGKIYAIGGMSSLTNFVGLSTVEVYDPVTDTWTSKANMPFGVWNLRTTVVDGKIYALGGRPYGTARPYVQEYDPATDTWTRKSDMPLSTGGMGSAVLGDKIIVIGGWLHSGNYPYTAVQMYDPETDIWTIEGDAPFRRASFSASVVNNRIYAIGGTDRPHPLPATSTVYELTVSGPPPDFNGDGIVDAADVCMMIDYWGTDEPSYDIAPPPFGDGVVDVNDLILLAEHLFEVYPSAETVDVNEADNGGQVELELGKLLVVTLESNPSTGYRWELIENDESVLKQFGQVEYKPSDTSDPPMVGAAGWEIFRFKAVSTGQMTLELVYHRTWEDVEPLKTFSVQVIVP
jgi:predicted secreted protein/N-acetylneuraminic acid mutarotase